MLAAVLFFSSDSPKHALFVKPTNTDSGIITELKVNTQGVNKY